uniref:Uncharacterized protein n=1 Tax=Rhizophora mucronata TaxID=61149 RepID=A0A2P2QZV7_RHIMU
MLSSFTIHINPTQYIQAQMNPNGFVRY